MGARFSRCLGISVKSSVLDSDNEFGADIYDEQTMAAIAMTLDEDESQNTGLILYKNNEV
tara:strand:- start:2929 stop:3108 length:180 start_codon:yes stop_codon:yes gene_type:complete